MDDTDAANAMAAAMGFSSFGAQDRPAKKRRFNDTRDNAVVAGQSHDSLLGPAPSSLPAKPPASSANALPLLPRNGGGGGSATNADEIDLGDDDDVGGDGHQRTQMDGPSSMTTTSAAGEYDHAADKYLGGARGGRSGQRGRGGFGGRGGNHGGGRADGEPWWTDYHDPSFNENPWGRLEQALGLEPRGSWLSRGRRGGLGAGGDVKSS